MLGISCCLFLRQIKVHNDVERKVLLNSNVPTFRKVKNNTESGNDNNKHDHDHDYAEEESNTTSSNSSSEPIIDAVFSYVNGR